MSRKSHSSSSSSRWLPQDFVESIVDRELSRYKWFVPDTRHAQFQCTMCDSEFLDVKKFINHVSSKAHAKEMCHGGSNHEENKKKILALSNNLSDCEKRLKNALLPKSKSFELKATYFKKVFKKGAKELRDLGFLEDKIERMERLKEELDVKVSTTKEADSGSECFSEYDDDEGIDNQNLSSDLVNFSDPVLEVLKKIEWGKEELGDFWCTLCETDYFNCHDFLRHLSSQEHLTALNSEMKRSEAVEFLYTHLNSLQACAEGLQQLIMSDQISPNEKQVLQQKTVPVCSKVMAEVESFVKQNVEFQASLNQTSQICKPDSNTEVEDDS